MNGKWECERCGISLNPAKPDTWWQHVEGWTRARQQGATNHVALREVTRPERFMCTACMALAQAQIDERQVSFL